MQNELAKKKVRVFLNKGMPSGTIMGTLNLIGCALKENEAPL